MTITASYPGFNVTTTANIETGRKQNIETGRVSSLWDEKIQLEGFETTENDVVDIEDIWSHVDETEAYRSFVEDNDIEDIEDDRWDGDLEEVYTHVEETKSRRDYTGTGKVNTNTRTERVPVGETGTIERTDNGEAVKVKVLNRGGCRDGSTWTKIRILEGEYEGRECTTKRDVTRTVRMKDIPMKTKSFDSTPVVGRFLKDAKSGYNPVIWLDGSRHYC